MSGPEKAAHAPAQDELAPQELVRRVAAACDDKLASDLVGLEVGPLVGYTDYMLIATARNERQAKAIHDEVHERLKREHGRLPAAVEGETEARWILMDYGECVLHVFVPELRERYRLEVLWGEAPRVDLGLPAQRPAPASDSSA